MGGRKKRGEEAKGGKHWKQGVEMLTDEFYSHCREFSVKLLLLYY